MTRQSFAICSLALLTGCLDMPARQQQAEVERREETAAKLKEMGEQLHMQHTATGKDESSADPEEKNPEAASETTASE